MIFQVLAVLFSSLKVGQSTQLDFSSCFGTSSFVNPPLSVSSVICKLYNRTKPAANICELYENDRFKLTFDVEKTVCRLSVQATASAVDENYFSLDDYSNVKIPANLTADHELKKYYLYLDIMDLPMRRSDFCFVFRGETFKNPSISIWRLPNLVYSSEFGWWRRHKRDLCAFWSWRWETFQEKTSKNAKLGKCTEWWLQSRKLLKVFGMLCNLNKKFSQL